MFTQDIKPRFRIIRNTKQKLEYTYRGEKSCHSTTSIILQPFMGKNEVMGEND